MSAQGLPNRGRVAGGFGYVTDEDRMRWDKQRRLTREARRARSFSQQAVSTMAETGGDYLRMRTTAQMIAAEVEGNRTASESTRSLADLVDFRDEDDLPALEEGELGF